MGTLVRSDVTYLDFITGRSVQQAAHYNDGAAGNVVGEVEEVRVSDVAIDQSEYDTIVASIVTYNAALPQPPAPVSVENTATDDLVAELDALFTTRGEALSEAEKADLKTKLLPMMREDN